jgi:hypothetical protein
VPAVLYDMTTRETIAHDRVETLRRDFAAARPTVETTQAFVDVLRRTGRRLRRRRPQLVQDPATKRIRDRVQGFPVDTTCVRGHARSLETSGFRVTTSFREAEDTPAAARPRSIRA